MLNAMEYPHWLIVAGAVLVAIGFIGLAFSRNRDVEPEPTEKIEDGKRNSDAAATLPAWPWRAPPHAS
jgi:hypothetical protein